jgi:hypothetical protein
MGAWGYEALESDDGLDVKDFLEENIPENFEFKLSEIITLMKGNLLGKNITDIDFKYDNTAMAIVELYFLFKDNGKFSFYYDEEDEDYGGKTLNVIKAFTADKKSLKYLLKYLTEIKNEIPDEEGEHEIVELWKDSEEWENWQKHLNNLIDKLQTEINGLNKNVS